MTPEQTITHINKFYSNKKEFKGTNLPGEIKEIEWNEQSSLFNMTFSKEYLIESIRRFKPTKDLPKIIKPLINGRLYLKIQKFIYILLD